MLRHASNPPPTGPKNRCCRMLQPLVLGRDPRHRLGLDLGPDRHMVAAIGREFWPPTLPPPPPDPQKMKFPAQRFGRAQIENFRRQSFWSEKHQDLPKKIPETDLLGYGIKISPKIGGYMVHAAALDLTTLFGVIFWAGNLFHRLRRQHPFFHRTTGLARKPRCLCRSQYPQYSVVSHPPTPDVVVEPPLCTGSWRQGTVKCDGSVRVPDREGSLRWTS